MLCHASVGEGDLAFYPTIWYTENLPTGPKKNASLELMPANGY